MLGREHLEDLWGEASALEVTNKTKADFSWDGKFK